MSEIEQARARHRIRYWADQCFDIGDDGHVVAQLAGQQHRLRDILACAKTHGARLPLLIRLPQLLEARCDALCSAFDAPLRAMGDKGAGFTPVYPIKVNQQTAVVSTLAQHPRCGLEAGSKPELIAAIAHANGKPVILNGYKDQQTIDLALTARALGVDTCIVIEKPDELTRVQLAAKRLNITPRLGIRLRLASLAAGKWQNSGGARAKFGLTARQLLTMIEQLRSQNQLHWVRMLHFHMGSQISALSEVSRGLSEGLQYYIELLKAGAPLDTLDVGGGLAVDYAGARSRDAFSMNYGMTEYAQCIVDTIAQRCAREHTAMPNLITEAGRAMTAHHAILLFDIGAVEDLSEAHREPASWQPPHAPHTSIDRINALSQQLQQDAGGANVQELLSDAESLLQAGLEQFREDAMSLKQRAAMESAYFDFVRDALARLDNNRRTHRELSDRLKSLLAVKCFANFSMFQSLPDIWGIDQVFPIVPISGLEFAPNASAIIEDLTCDSDGRIERFIDHDSIEATLPIHLPLPCSTFATFLVGAYQETLGDIHNLFGDTDTVFIRSHNDALVCESHSHGDNTAQLLQYVGFDPENLRHRFQQLVQASDVPDSTRTGFMTILNDGLSAYSYLHPD